MKNAKLIIFGVLSLFIPTLLIYQYIQIENLKKLNTGYKVPCADSTEISELQKELVYLYKILHNSNSEKSTIQVLCPENLGNTQNLRSEKILEKSVTPHVSLSVVLTYFQQLDYVFEKEICKQNSSHYCDDYRERRAKYERIKQSISYLEKNYKNIHLGSDFSILLEEVKALIEESSFYYSLVQDSVYVSSGAK